MKRIIIFRFHDYFDVCENRLKLLKKYNPEILIYGIFGGDEKYNDNLPKYLRKYFADVFYLKGKSGDWKWKNFDFALQEWFREQGEKIDFDFVHVVEWDLLLFDSLLTLCPNPKESEVYLTGLVPINKVKKTLVWVTEEPYKQEYPKLLDYVKKNLNFTDDSYASLGPGLSFNRAFIERYSKEPVPEFCNDEIRVTLFAQVYGFELRDTNFQKKWFNEHEYKYFNCINKNIDSKIIAAELKKESGRRVFHPFREKY